MMVAPTTHREFKCNGDAYSARALERELGDLSSTPREYRNHALNRSSFNLFQLVAGGELDGDQVLQGLMAAAAANGLLAEDGLHRSSAASRAAPAPACTSSHPVGAAMNLRPYQSRSYRSVRARGRGRAQARPPGRRRPARGKTSSARIVIGAAVERCTTSWCSRIAARSSAQTSDKLRRHGIPHGIIQAGISAATARAGAGRSDPDAASARHPAPRPWSCRRPICGHRRSATTPGRDLSEDHRRLSRRDAARPHGHAMPWRRPRARRHLRDHDRMPAGRAS